MIKTKKFIWLGITLVITGTLCGCGTEAKHTGINKYIHDKIATSNNHEIKIGTENVSEHEDGLYGSYYQAKVYEDEDKDKAVITTYDLFIDQNKAEACGDIHYTVNEPYVSHTQDNSSYLTIKDKGEHITMVNGNIVPVYDVQIYVPKSGLGNTPKAVKIQ